MISLSVVLWVFVVLFGVIGGLRGWAKEILVLFCMVLALFLDIVITQFVPGAQAALDELSHSAQFSVRALFFLLLAFFGYETPAISLALGAKARRERLEDILLGLVIGLLNGYLLVGTLWYYLDATGYPVTGITRPTDSAVLNLLDYMPPELVGIPYIYFAMGLAFVFVLVVFI